MEYELGESAAAAAAAEKIRKTFSSVRLYELELGNVVKTRLARLRSLRTAAVWRFALLSLPHLYEALRLPPCTFALPVWNTKMLGRIPRSATGELRFPMQYSVSGDRNHAAAATAVVMMVRIERRATRRRFPLF